MRRAWAACGVVALVTLASSDTAAFTIQTGLTDGCHERFATDAFLSSVESLPVFPDEATPRGAWEGVASEYIRGADALDRGARFFLYSLVLGARAPDTEGHSITNAQALRAAQADPGNQHVHCLRAAEDDYDAGNTSALLGCRAEIVASLVHALDAVQASGGERSAEVVEIYVTLDLYGAFQTKVWAPAFHLGRALHTLQDSFAHSLRDPTFRTVVHVMNFEAPLVGRNDELRDGLAHSVTMDRCRVPPDDVEGALQRARLQAVVDAGAQLLVLAPSLVDAATDGPEPTLTLANEVMDTWLSRALPNELGPYDACTLENDYCASPWLPIARRQPTTPALGCAASVRHPRRGGALPLGWLMFGLTLFLRRAVRRRPRRARLAEAGWYRASGTGSTSRTNFRLGRVTLVLLLACGYGARAARAQDVDVSEADVQDVAVSEADVDVSEADDTQRPAEAPSVDARPPRHAWVGAALHGSIFGDLLDRSTVLPRFGYGLRGGCRFGRWGVFGLIERDHWIVSELALRHESGVLNIAIGSELLYANGRVAASLAVGVSVLLRDQPLDERGTTGLYVALRPASLRYAVRRRATVQVDLLSLVVEAPVLHYPVLVEIQYRTSVTFELGV